jgi:long-chain acyl-CoA synthetase
MTEDCTMGPHDIRVGEPIHLSTAERAANLVELVHRTVERHPDRVALRWKTRDAGEGRPITGTVDAGWTRLTYRQLWDLVEAVSLGLRDLGMQPGDRVVILSRSRPEWVVADLASLALGAVTCPIFSAERPYKVEFMIRNVAARFIFVESAHQAAKLMGDDPKSLGIEQVVAFDPSGSPAPATVSFAHLSAGGDRSVGSRSTWHEGWSSIERDTVATIVHTSGTSGEPKGVILTHGNVIHNFEAASQAIPFDENDRALSVLPLSHMLERAAGIYVPLGIGAEVAFAEPVMERWAANLAEVRPTIMVTIPLFFQRIHQRVLAEVGKQPAWKRRLFRWASGLGARRYANHLAGRRDGIWLGVQLALAGRLVFAPIKARTGGRLRYFCSGGAPLPREVGEFFYAMDMLILEGYGLSETAPLLAISRPESFRFGTVGPPAAETEIVIDPQSGEILARGPQVMRGYLNAPQETADAIGSEGWFHTGDIGEFDEAGRLRITDRIKNLIVLNNGKKVSPTPMETRLASSSYISQAVIIGDGQGSTGALVVPDFDRIRSWQREAGMVAANAATTIDRPEVIALIEREVRGLLRDFAAYERPRHVALLPRELSEERDEIVGPLRKPKRRVIVAFWPAQVVRLFPTASHEA